MLIRTQEELFRGPVKIRHLTENGITVSKIFFGEKLKVLFDGEILRRGDVVEIRGRMFVEKTVECPRCLEEFKANVSEEVRVFLKPSYMLSGDEEIELRMEDLDDDFYEGDEMDFYDYILLLGESIVPPYILCSESCKGICISCGENLNRVSCGCSAKSSSEFHQRSDKDIT